MRKSGDTPPAPPTSNRTGAFLMRLLATYSNMGEAGFVQSVLQSAGIDARLTDPRNILGGVQQVGLEVQDDDFDRAYEVVSQIETAADPSEPSDSATEHPAQGYPAIGISILGAAAGLVVGAADTLIVHHADLELGHLITRTLATALGGAMGGFVLGLLAALLGLPIYGILRRRSRHRP